MKNRMREIRTSGSVGDGDGNVPIYPATGESVGTVPRLQNSRVAPKSWSTCFWDSPKLRESLDAAAREERRFIVGMIDLDGFKSVNDIHGHTTGDKVLIEAGRRMRDVCGDTIFLARLGGDEFAVIIGEDMDDAGVMAFGDRMCSVLDAPFTFPGIITQVFGSIGFATFPEAGSSAELLFERADYALYHAKENMRGRLGSGPV